MDFGDAIRHLKLSKRVTRQAWSADGVMWLAYQPSYRGTAGELHPHCIVMQTDTDAFLPWLPSQEDMLAEDWKLWTVPGVSSGV